MTTLTILITSNPAETKAIGDTLSRFILRDFVRRFKDNHEDGQDKPRRLEVTLFGNERTGTYDIP